MIDKNISKKLDEIIEKMSIDELCGQVLNYNVSPSWTEEYIAEVSKRTHPCGIFWGEGTTERLKKCA